MTKYYINKEITIKELCNLVKINENEFIKKTFLNGINIKKNEILNFQKTKKICKTLFNIDVFENDLKENVYDFNYFNISITGNVNSGKTTLMDFIFKKNISCNETGKITQYVTVYETLFLTKKMFIFDLPGHKIFNLVIETIINISNVLFLIISAEDKVDIVYENIFYLTKKNNINVIICLNKIDIIDKNFYINNQKIFKISSKNGYNIKKLMLYSIKNNNFNKIKFLKDFNGVIINSYIKDNNFIVTIFLFKGEVKLNDFLYFKNKIVFIDNIYLNNKFINYVKSPCIINIKNVDFPVDFFFSLNKNIFLNKNIYIKNNFDNFYVKLDNHTIAISISNYFNNLNNNKINLLKISLGNFTINDLKYCLEFKCKIILIGLKLNYTIKKEIIKNNLFLKEFNLIHDFIIFFKEIYNSNKTEQILAELEVKNVFLCNNGKKIAGCFVKNGILNIDNSIKIYKELKLIYEGKIDTLKIKNKNIDKIYKNKECGIIIKNFNDIEIGMKIYSIKYFNND